ncbi:MAG: DUF4350 domain-containing protein [Saprospiraceae bacterium]
MNNQRLFLVLGGIGLVVLLLFIIFGANRSKFDWKEHYEKEKIDPYGLYIADQLLRELFPEQQLFEITDSLNEVLVDDSRTTIANYVFVGSGMYLNDNDTGELLEFVEMGNNALLSSQSLPYQIAVHLGLEFCDEEDDDYYGYDWTDYDYLYDTIAQVNFTHPDLEQAAGYELKYRYKKEVRSRAWAYLDGNFMCEDTIAVLGILNDSLANFVRVPYGAGYFYLHSNPLAFTNIHLLREEYLAYFNGVFQHLPAGDIYLDYASQVDVEVARRNNQDYNQAGEKKLTTEHPMKYILSQLPLRWAWYLLLALALLYVLFRAKRRQRIIPVLQRNENSSLEFIQTIGRLNFLKNNHRQAVLQQMKLWQSHVRERYHILPKSEDFVEKLSAKAKFPTEHLEKILLIHRNVEASTYASEKILVEFHGLLERFYQKEKK